MLGFLFSGALHAKERLLVLDGVPASALHYLTRVDPYQPLTPGSTFTVDTLGSVFGMPAYFTYADTLSIDPATGRLFTIVRYVTQFGTLASMVEIDRETGEITDLGGPSTITGKYAFDPVTHAFHSVNGIANWKYTAPGGSGSVLPDLAFAPGDANAAFTPAIAGFEFTPLAPGVSTTTCFGLDSNRDALCRIDFATGLVTTVGALGLDVPSVLAGPVIDVDHTLMFSADYGNGPRRIEVDLDSGVATDVGAFPALHGVTDFVLDPDLSGEHDADSDGFPDVIELAAGSHPGDDDSRPFASEPIPGDAASLADTLKVTLDFASDAADTYTLKGFLPISQPFEVTGRTLIVEVGNDAHAFTLDAKGKAVSTAGAKLALKKPAKKGPLKGQLPFELKRKKADLNALFAEHGLIDGDVSAASVSLHVSLWLDGACYALDRTLNYDAVFGDHGKAK